ncbi:MAG: tRNA (adenosine(37)-N6)-threonylcarbamoyltransferase complex dimerization subunit type 1 TsaB [Blastocatellales bacterium]
MSNTGFKADCAEPIILAVDTSSSEASLAVSNAEDVIATLTIRNNRPHSQTLFSQISTLLHLAELKIQDVGAFAVATGPGSFTGLRVGLAAVKGLADSMGRPCLGVDSLDLLALASGLDGAHLVMIYAGRGEVYCGFREIVSGDIVESSVTDRVGSPSSVLRAMEQYLKQTTIIVIGGGGLKYKDEVFDFINKLQQGSVRDHGAQQPIFLTPASTASAGLAQRAARLIRKNQVAPARAHYIRPSDAEIKWKP